MQPASISLLTICGLEELESHSTRAVTHVLSILDPEWPDPEAFTAYDPHHRTILRFHDAIEPGRNVVLPQLAPAPDVRVVRPRDVTIVSGSRFRVGNERYQVFGVRAPRSRGGQCVMERLRGRQSRAALRRILSRGEIRIAPTGQVNALGDRIARVTVDGHSVARRLVDARAAVARRLSSDSYNPWCISLRRPPTPPGAVPVPAR